MELAEDLATDAGNRDRIVRTRAGSRSGVADGIEQPDRIEDEPGEPWKLLWGFLAAGEYAAAT